MGEFSFPSLGESEGAGGGANALVPLDSSTDSGASTSATGVEGDRDEISTAGITVAASHQASLMQGGQVAAADSPSPSDSETRDLEPVGTLNVGDRYASSSLNSPETARAATQKGIHDRASMTLTVSAPSPSLSTPSDAPTAASSPQALESSPERTSSFTGVHSFGSSRDDDEEMRRRLLIQIFGTGSQGSAAGAATTASGNSPQSAVGPGTQRYIFDVHDVHDMGGTPSRLSLYDARSGDLLGSRDLPEGDSRFAADLPPGEYRIEAQSGSRPGSGGADQLDNFRVEVSTTGPASGGAGDG